jgi:molybdate transport system substrate-binding protein
MTYNGTQQTPFFYATGSLELYSPTVDISAGLPSTLTTPVVIALPSAAPYGLAAMTVVNTYNYSALGGPLTTTSSYPVASLVYTEPNIGVTYESITDGFFQYGFIHKSAICKNINGAGETFPGGGYHHEYVYSDTSHPYSQIVQNGLPIELGQSSGKKGQIVNFIAYLHGTGGSGSLNALSIIDTYCYGTTSP